MLAVAVCAALAGARSYLAIAEWTADLPAGAGDQVGLGRRLPNESTIRRVLQAVDAEALDQAVSAWLASRSRRSSGPPGPLALDGKTVRGARCRSQAFAGLDARALHLLAALDTATGVVLGQSVVAGKTNEISAFGPLLDRIELSGRLVTADALHTQRVGTSNTWSAAVRTTC